MGQMNPLAPPSNPNSPVDTAPPELDPTTGELQAPQQQQQQQPQGGGGFMDTIRQARDADPQQFYNLLAHLAAGATPQQFSEMQNTYQQLKMQEQGMEQQQADRQENLEYRREAATARLEAQQEYREQVRTDRLERELRGVLDATLKSKYAPDAEALFMAETGESVTIDTLGDFRTFRAELENKGIQEKRFFEEAEKLVEGGVVDEEAWSPFMKQFIADNPKYRGAVNAFFDTASRDKDQAKIKFDMAVERHNAAMADAKKREGRLKVVDKTRWDDEDNRRFARLQRKADRAAALAAVYDTSINRAGVDAYLAENVPIFAVAHENHKDALDALEEIEKEFDEFMAEMHVKHGGVIDDDSGGDGEVSKPTSTDVPPKFGTPAFNALDTAGKLAAIKYHTKPAE